MKSLNNRIRIGMLCHTGMGGSGVFACELGRELADRGHHVYFFGREKPVRFEEGHDNIEFCQVRSLRYPLFEESDDLFPLVGEVVNVCCEKGIDVLHAHYAIPHAMVALMAREIQGRAGPAVVTTLHGTDVVMLGKHAQYKSVIAHALRSSDRVTCVSKNLKSKAEQYFGSIEGMETIYNFYRFRRPAEARDKVRTRLGVGEEPLAIHLSNLRTVKRFDLLLESFALARSRVDFKLLVISGGEEGSYEPEIASRGLLDSVIVVKDVLHVEDYINAADFSLYTSEYESFCLGILECLAHGLPALAFDVGGIPEVVEHGSTGFLLPFGDVEGLSRKIVTMASNEKMCLKMGENARAHAGSRFTAKASVNRYEAVYRRAIERASVRNGRVGAI